MLFDIAAFVIFAKQRLKKLLITNTEASWHFPFFMIKYFVFYGIACLDKNDKI